MDVPGTGNGTTFLILVAIVIIKKVVDILIESVHGAAPQSEPAPLPAAPAQTPQRLTDVVAAPLPAGTYYLEYEVDDLFTRSYTLDRFEMKWDGEKITLPDDLSWEGSIVLQWNPE